MWSDSATLAGLLCAAALSGCGSPARPPGGTPNVLIYTFDALRADDLGCYGASVTRTPAIDRLAADGTVFLDASSVGPGTPPAVASLLTGVPATVHGVQRLGGTLPDAGGALVRLPELLRQAGYYTAAVVANPNVSRVFGFDGGFDAFHELRPLGAERAGSRADAPAVVEKVRAVIEGAPADRPFFVYVHSIDPHMPYSPPPPYDTMYDKDADAARDGSREALMRFDAEVRAGRPPAPDRIRALYRGEITYGDAHFGRLVDWLRETGRLDSTLVVVTADHGEGFLEHGERGHGNSLFEELTHVPLILRHPASFPAGGRRTEPVDTLDLSATVVVVAGAERPAHWIGRDLRRPLVPRVIVSTNRTPKVSQIALRLDGYKVIYDEAGERGEYYYLPEDRGERHPLTGERRAQAEALLAGKVGDFQRLTTALRERFTHSGRELSAEPLPEDVRRSLEALGYVGD